MFAKSRQEIIYERIKKHGAVKTTELVKDFDVSIETVRRDLLSMEDEGLLKRVHGGAVIKSGMKPFLNLDERNMEYNAEKTELSKKAVKFIDEGDVLAIDTGSTAIFFSEVLKNTFENLTVVTHSIDVLQILGDKPGFSIILCGGYYNKSEKALYGELAVEMLSKLNVKKAFIFPSAVSLGGGICDYEYEMLQVQKQLINASEQVFILADSSKFEKKALLKVDEMKTDYIYITDDSLSDNLKNIYKENNIKVY